MQSWSMYLLMYKFSGYLTELVLEIITVLFRAAKVFRTLQDQWIDMRVHVFAGASRQKNMHKCHKKVFSLVEISNIYKTRDNAKKTGDCRSFGIRYVWHVWTFWLFYIVLYSFSVVTCVFSCCCDKLKQFEPAHDAVSLNSFAVSNTLNTFTSCKYKNTLDMNL
jgi:hypothetical protein